MSTTASRQYDYVDDKASAVPITASRIDADFDNCITKLNQKVIISASAPASPIAGQLWYDSTNKLLKEYRNTEWIIRGMIHISGTAPATLQDGDLWNDITNNILYKYDTDTWVKVGNMSFPTSAAYGDINYTALTTTLLNRLGVSGTVGLVLTNNGTSSTPLWGKVTPSATASFNILGAWVDKSASYGAQQATTDGFVVCVSDGGGGGGSVTGYTDTNADPTTVRCYITKSNYQGVDFWTFTMPVRKGDYWKVVFDTWTVEYLYWIPLGS